MLKFPALVLALFVGAAAQAMDSPDVGVPWLYPGFAVLAFVWSGAEILSFVLQRNNRSALVALSEIFSRAIPPVRLAHANNTQYATRSQGFSVGNFVAQTAWTELPHTRMRAKALERSLTLHPYQRRILSASAPTTWPTLFPPQSQLAR